MEEEQEEWLNNGEGSIHADSTGGQVTKNGYQRLVDEVEDRGKPPTEVGEHHSIWDRIKHKKTKGYTPTAKMQYGSTTTGEMF